MTIVPGSALPAITDPVTLDGAAVGPGPVEPAVEIDGQAVALVDAVGLFVAAPGSTVKGVAIRGFPGAQIQLTAANGTVTSSWIGLGLQGTPAGRSGRAGVVVQNAGAQIDGNVVASAGTAVAVRGGSTGALVRGNRIGVDPTGAVVLPSSGDGVLVDGEASQTTISGNTIAGGDIGIDLFHARSTTVTGNVVGLSPGGAAREQGTLNDSFGAGRGVVVEDSAFTRVGGAGSDGNTISNSRGAGVVVLGTGSTRAQVLGNRIGTTMAGDAVKDAAGKPTGNGGPGVFVGSDQDGTRPDDVDVGDPVSAVGNVLAGNQFGVYVREADHPYIVGNLVGTSVDGKRALGNTKSGIFVDNGAADAVVGGPVAPNRVIASGESGIAVEAGARGVVVASNRLGVTADGKAAPNREGISVSAAATCVGGAPVGGRMRAGERCDRQRRRGEYDERHPGRARR